MGLPKEKLKARSSGIQRESDFLKGPSTAVTTEGYHKQMPNALGQELGTKQRFCCAFFFTFSVKRVVGSGVEGVLHTLKMVPQRLRSSMLGTLHKFSTLK